MVLYETTLGCGISEEACGLQTRLGIDPGLKEDVALIDMGNQPFFEKGSMED